MAKKPINTDPACQEAYENALKAATAAERAKNVTNSPVVAELNNKQVPEVGADNAIKVAFITQMGQIERFANAVAKAPS